MKKQAKSKKWWLIAVAAVIVAAIAAILVIKLRKPEPEAKAAPVEVFQDSEEIPESPFQTEPKELD